MLQGVKDLQAIMKRDLGRGQPDSKTYLIIPISWTLDLILITADSPECPLSDEIC